MVAQINEKMVAKLKEVTQPMKKKGHINLK
jgi:hypothetical protein